MLGYAICLAVLGLSFWVVDTPSAALPVIRDDLGLSATVAGMVVSFFFIGRLVANIPAAWLVDRGGPKRTVLTGAALLLVGSVLAAIAPSPPPLLVARVFQGSGVAFLATAALLSILRARPAGGAAMTAFNVSAGIGGAFGLVIGGFLTGAIGWRSVFWQSALISAVLLAIGIFAKERPAGLKSEAEETAQATAGLSHARGLLVFALAANFLVYTNYCIWAVGVPLYSAEVLNASPERLGQLLVVISTVHLLGAFVVGRRVRVNGPYPVLATGMLLVAVGVFSAIAISSTLGLLLPMVLYALGEVSGNISAGDLVLRLGGGAGKAVGMVRLTSDLGMVLGPILAGVLADHYGVRAPFIAVGVMSFVAALMVLSLMLILRRRLRHS